MPNIFSAADAKASAALSRVMGERIQWLPWKAGGDFTAGGADPDRAPAQPVIFTAILSGALGRMNSSGDRADNFRGYVTTRDRELSIDQADFPDVAIKLGDHFKALDQPGEPEFEAVASPLPDGSGSRIIIPLVTK